MEAFFGYDPRGAEVLNDRIDGLFFSYPVIVVTQ